MAEQIVLSFYIIFYSYIKINTQDSQVFPCKYLSENLFWCIVVLGHVLIIICIVENERSHDVPNLINGND